MKPAVITVLILAFMSLLASIFLFNYYQVTWDAFKVNTAENKVSVAYMGEFDPVANGKLNLELCNTDLELIESATVSSMLVTATTYQSNKNNMEAGLPVAEVNKGEIRLSTCGEQNRDNWQLWNFGWEDEDEEKWRNKMTIVVPTNFEWEQAKIESSWKNNQATGVLRGKEVTLRNQTWSFNAYNLDLFINEKTGSLTLNNQSGQIVATEIKAPLIEVNNNLGRVDIKSLIGNEIKIRNEVGGLEIDKIEVGEKLLADNGTGSLTVNLLLARAAEVRVNNAIGEVTIGLEGVTSEMSLADEMILRNDTGGIDLSRLAANKIELDNRMGTVRAVDCEAVWEISNDVGTVEIEGGQIKEGSLVLNEGLGGEIKTVGTRGELVKKVGSESVVRRDLVKSFEQEDEY